MRFRCAALALLVLALPAHALDRQTNRPLYDGVDVRAKRTAPPNGDGAELAVQNTPMTGYQIYGPQVPPGWTYRSGIRASVVALPGSTDINTSGFDYYVLNRQAASTDGLGRNAVGLFGVTACVVDNSACWGINPALIDNTTNGVTTNGVGRKLIGAEFDFSTTSPHSIVQGVSLNGSSQVQPAGADGFTCGSLGGPAIWTHCFVVGDGIANVGMYLGAAAGPTSGIRPSLPIEMAYYGADGVGHSIRMLATNGLFGVQPSAGGNGIALQTTAKGVAPFIAPLSDEDDMGLELHANGDGPVVSRSNFVADKNLSVNNMLSVARATLGDLPVSNVPLGTIYYCIDCRKPGEAAGAGSGMLVFRDNAHWNSTAGTTAQN